MMTLSKETLIFGFDVLSEDKHGYESDGTGDHCALRMTSILNVGVRS